MRAATWTRRLVRRGRRGPEPLLPQVTARIKDDEQSHLAGVWLRQAAIRSVGRLKACFFCYRWRDCGTAGEPRRLPTT